jgi:hypothetical protein
MVAQDLAWRLWQRIRGWMVMDVDEAWDLMVTTTSTQNQDVDGLT